MKIKKIFKVFRDKNSFVFEVDYTIFKNGYAAKYNRGMYNLESALEFYGDHLSLLLCRISIVFLFCTTSQVMRRVNLETLSRVFNDAEFLNLPLLTVSDSESGIKLLSYNIV